MKLPEIYKNKIDENIRNSQTTFRSSIINKNNINLPNKFPINVYLETSTRKLNTTLIGKTDNYIITKNKEVISIKDLTILKEV